MVAERHAGVAKRVIEQAAAEVLGFVPVVKIGGQLEFVGSNELSFNVVRMLGRGLNDSRHLSGLQSG